MLDKERFHRGKSQIIFIKVLHDNCHIEGLLPPMREAGSHRIKIQICLASYLSSKTMEKGIIQNFQFYENEKLFKNGKYLTISLDFVRFCEGIFRLEDYSNL